VGTVIVIIGLLTLAGIWSTKLGIIGGLLAFLMSIVTLSYHTRSLCAQFRRWLSHAALRIPLPFRR